MSLIWFFLQVLPLLTSSLFVQAQRQPYNFTPPATYRHCAFDPDVGHFLFLDTRLGMPLVYYDGVIQVGEFTDTELVNIAWYLKFTRASNVRNGTWDLVLHDPEIGQPLYVSVYDNGLLGLEPASSAGQQWRLSATHGSARRYVSAVWGLECPGKLRAGIDGPNGYEFDLFTKDRLVVTRPQQAGGKETVALGYDLRKFGPLRPLAESDLVEDPPPEERGIPGFSRRSSHFGSMSRRQDREQPVRCQRPKRARVKEGARAPGTNGCGTDFLMRTADWNFGQCCDGHDFCFDDCGIDFKTCNSRFDRCMYDTCVRKHPRDSRAFRACNTLGYTYARIVESEIGLGFYHDAGEERCECVCPDHMVESEDGCIVPPEAPGGCLPPPPECCSEPDHWKYCCIC